MADLRCVAEDGATGQNTVKRIQGLRTHKRVKISKKGKLLIGVNVTRISTAVETSCQSVVFCLRSSVTIFWDYLHEYTAQNI